MPRAIFLGPAGAAAGYLAGTVGGAFLLSSNTHDRLLTGAFATGQPPALVG